MYTKAQLESQLELLTSNYKFKLQDLEGCVNIAQGKLDRISTHDAFNMSATCGELQELAAQIELLQNMIVFSKED